MEFIKESEQSVEIILTSEDVESAISPEINHIKINRDLTSNRRYVYKIHNKKQYSKKKALPLK